jgi:hypothetical protein
MNPGSLSSLPSRYVKVAWLGAIFGVFASIIGCSTYKSHHKEWIGTFMFDSVTAGAVLLEYDEESPRGNTFGSSDQYNVNVDLFRYDFISGTLKKERRLFQNMKDAAIYRVTEYNPPLLLQSARYSDGTAVFNLETGEKKILKVRVEHLSANKGFYSNAVTIIDATTMDTVLFLNKNDESIYYFDEKSNQYLSLKSEKINEVWSSHFQTQRLNQSGVVKLLGVPRVYFSEDHVINWSERKTPFFARSNDSISVSCDVDSILQNILHCDTFPRPSLPLGRFVGSFKTHHFVGVRDEGLYACSGKSSCQATLISSGGYSEK